MYKNIVVNPNCFLFKTIQVPYICIVRGSALLFAFSRNKGLLLASDFVANIMKIKKMNTYTSGQRGEALALNVLLFTRYIKFKGK